MMSQLLVLLCTESLPKPSLRAWPSLVMPRWSNVTLQCQTSTKNVNFVLRKGKVPLESVRSWIPTDGLAEFQLTELQPSDAGAYTCDYYRQRAPHTRSKPSDILLLLVTGSFLKPSLQAHQRSEVTTGDTVTLRCQTPANVYETIMFALLKVGAAGTVQLQGPVKKETDFSLQNVTAGDTGNYSCVYFQTSAPFWASEPSDHLEIWVTDKTETKRPKTVGTGIGTPGITLIVISIFLVLLGAFLICKYTRCGAAPQKVTKRSHSEGPEEVWTSTQPEKENGDPSAAMTSSSLALVSLPWAIPVPPVVPGSPSLPPSGFVSGFHICHPPPLPSLYCPGESGLKSSVVSLTREPPSHDESFRGIFPPPDMGLMLLLL
ncbi:T-cell-interacting, activating receptor on myeloid cells protein 1-like isoform X3 [Mustela erminea]|uniref:T-cell-interacting, activating receptor on myeloid cells protein 1-like isoform X3 n=1 Tax=Mustela erminea TaxID=36723 RepID=UPI001386D03E|nr:T-cell-interacting, activating receptor on myeloid cells protein 1-like isoform X3 [Mustela erminea]